jgi:hypothetical protein
MRSKVRENFSRNEDSSHAKFLQNINGHAQYQLKYLNTAAQSGKSDWPK